MNDILLTDNSIVGEEAIASGISYLAMRLKKYAEGMQFFIPKAPYTKDELEKKYENAKNYSAIEHVWGGNSQDIVDFHHSLLQQTVWECKECIEMKIYHFIINLADSLCK
jgi:hypothetical protein